MPRPSRVCSHVGCPELQPCPTHSRPRNAPWTTGRDRKTQDTFRRHTLERDRYRCQRCGHHDPTGRTLDAHHITPTQGQTLCNTKANGCHAAVDTNAR